MTVMPCGCEIIERVKWNSGGSRWDTTYQEIIYCSQHSPKSPSSQPP